MNSNEQAVAKAAATVDGKKIITCGDALGLSAKLGIAPAEVGAICNALGIKIRECKLGCFK